MSQRSFGSRMFTHALLKVAGLIWVLVGSLVPSLVCSSSFAFTLVHSCAPRCVPVHSRSRGFTPALLRRFVGFISVHMRSLWGRIGRRVHSNSRGYTQARIGVVRFILVRVGSRGCTKVSSG